MLLVVDLVEVDVRRVARVGDTGVRGVRVGRRLGARVAGLVARGVLTDTVRHSRGMPRVLRVLLGRHDGVGMRGRHRVLLGCGWLTGGSGGRAGRMRGVCGAGVFGSVRVGLLLYALHILSALLTGLALTHPGRGAPSPSAARRESPRLPFTSALVRACERAAETSIKVAAFITLFAVFASLLDACGALRACMAVLAPACRLAGALTVLWCAAAPQPFPVFAPAETLLPLCPVWMQAIPIVMILLINLKFLKRVKDNL